MKINQVAKSIVAALTSFGGLWNMATMVGTPGGDLGQGVTANEWVTIVVGSLVAGVLVWAVPNARPDEVVMRSETTLTAPQGYEGRNRAQG